MGGWGENCSRASQSQIGSQGSREAAGSASSKLRGVLILGARLGKTPSRRRPSRKPPAALGCGRVLPLYPPKDNPEGRASQEGRGEGRCTIRGDRKEQVEFSRLGSGARPSQRPWDLQKVRRRPGQVHRCPHSLRSRQASGSWHSRWLAGWRAGERGVTGPRVLCSPARLSEG